MTQKNRTGQRLATTFARTVAFVVGGLLAGAVGLLLVAGQLVFIIFPTFHIGRVFFIPNSGMAPLIAKGDYIYMNELAYRNAPPARGDIVCFRGEGLPTLVHTWEWQVKRVAGLPGETLSIRGRTLYVGEHPAPGLSRFPYQIFDFDRFLTWENDSFTVPPKTYFVLGDFPNGSYDSRFLGPIPRANIKGKAIFCLWPPSRFGRLK